MAGAEEEEEMVVVEEGLRACKEKGEGETNVLAGVAGAEGVDPVDDLHALVVAVFPGPGLGHACCGGMTWVDRARTGSGARAKDLRFDMHQARL
jgi:hypothetical protein